MLEEQFRSLMAQMEDKFNQQLAQLNKRFHVIETQLKQKIKLLESKASIPTQKKQDTEAYKYKAKIYSLEKQLELYRLKFDQHESKETTPYKETTVTIILQLLDDAIKAFNIYFRDINLAEIYYPLNYSLIGYGIDLLPSTITQPVNMDKCHSLIEILSSQTHLLYNQQVFKERVCQNLEELRQFNKSPQYHVNEIMQNGISNDFSIYFNPQTQYWKKKLKIKCVSKLQSDNALKLIQHSDAQQHIIELLEDYLQSSFFTVERELFDQVRITNVIDEKKIVLTRFHCILLILMIAANPQSIRLALRNLQYDIQTRNGIFLFPQIDQYINIVYRRCMEYNKDFELQLQLIELLQVLHDCSQLTFPHQHLISLSENEQFKEKLSFML